MTAVGHSVATLAAPPVHAGWDCPEREPVREAATGHRRARACTPVRLHTRGVAGSIPAAPIGSCGFIEVRICFARIVCPRLASPTVAVGPAAFRRAAETRSRGPIKQPYRPDLYRR